jgi:thioredoxin
MYCKRETVTGIVVRCVRNELREGTFNMKYGLKFMLIVVAGALAGAVLGYVGQCRSGTCPLTANPLRGAGFGVFFGVLLALNGGASSGRARGTELESEQIVFVRDGRDLEALITGAKVPVVVDFYTDWCRPCKRMSVELSKLAERWKGDALVVKVNVDKQPEIAAEYNIGSIPDLRVFVDGQERVGSVGYKSVEQLHDMLVAVGGISTTGKV